MVRYYYQQEDFHLIPGMTFHQLELPKIPSLPQKALEHLKNNEAIVLYMPTIL